MNPSPMAHGPWPMAHCPLPIADPGRCSIYTGRATSWPMVVATCAGTALLALMSRGVNGEWR